MPELEELIQTLQDADPRRRGEALREIKQMDLNPMDCARVLSACTVRYEPTPDAFWGIPTCLLMALWGKTPPELADDVERILPALASDWRAVEAAIRLLTEIGTDTSVAKAVSVWRSPLAAEVTGGTPFIPLMRSAPHIDSVFPRLLEPVLPVDKASAAFALTLRYLEAGSLNLESYPSLWAPILDTARGLLESDPDHGGPVACELISQLPGSEADGLLTSALETPFPDTRLEAVLGLCRRGRPVPAETLEGLAADNVTRAPLFIGLEKLERLSDFPPAYSTQRLLAESAMVQWLCFPMELGKPPQAIECVFEDEFVQDDQTLSVYLFRFQTPEGWCAGMSGPYIKGRLSGRARMTWSSFTPWDDLSPEGHLDAMSDAIGSG